MLWSVLRTDRTGPTRVGRVRVEDRGEARDAALDDLLVHDVGLVDAVLRAPASVLLIFTVTAGRVNDDAVGSGRPVSGAAGDLRRAGLSWSSAAVVAAAFLRSPPPRRRERTRAPRRDRPRRAIVVTRRISADSACSHRLQGVDPVVERRVRVEQVVELDVPLFVSLSSGSSIHSCAVAFDAEWIDVWSSFSFSSAEISPGG